MFNFRGDPVKMIEDIVRAWKNYNEAENSISFLMGRTRNIVGEYAELLFMKHLDARQLNASNRSADLICKNDYKYQVKGRKTGSEAGLALGVIRSWDFDYLCVLIFSMEGTVEKALICPKDRALLYAKENNHQHGHVITATKKFLSDPNFRDVTPEIREINGEDISSGAHGIVKHRVTPVKGNFAEKRVSHFDEKEKPLNRIRLWAVRKNQINHKIIKAFLHLSGGFVEAGVAKSALRDFCMKELRVDTFDGHLASMSTSKGNSHGKVFEESGGMIYVWAVVRFEIQKYIEFYS